MPEDIDQLTDLASRGLEQLQQEDPSDWFDLSGWKLQALAGLFALLIATWLYRKVRRAVRRRRPPTIHPKLQKYGHAYGEPDEKLLKKRRVEAERIIATSSTATIAGYDIVQQVEAVFIDGFRRPEEALEGLKAVAALKGANALTNVQQQRDNRGQCGASGDAVIIRCPVSSGDDHPTEPAAEPGDARVEDAG